MHRQATNAHSNRSLEGRSVSKTELYNDEVATTAKWLDNITYLLPPSGDCGHSGMKNKEKMDITLLLPHVKDVSDPCIHRLAEMLRAKQGVTRVHAESNPQSKAVELCIHVDQHTVSWSELREYARRAGLSLEARFGHWIEETNPMPARLASLRSQQLSAIPGVLEAVVVADGTVRLEYDKSLLAESSVKGVIDRIVRHAHHEEAHTGADGRASSEPYDQRRTGSKDDVQRVLQEHAHCQHKHTHKHEQEHQHHHMHGKLGGFDAELLCAVAAGLCILVAWFTSMFTAVPAYVSVGLYALAYALTGWFMAREAIERLWLGRFEIESLMLLAAAGAAYLGKWPEGALLLFLFSVGHALESYAMGRARRAIEALTQLAPATATVKRDGKWTEVPVDDLQVSEVVAVKPNERVSADGFVVSGTSSVNQAPVTGESVPVDKRPVDDPSQASRFPEKLPAEHRVYAGTINGAKALEIQVTRPASDNTLSRIVQLVSEAETRVSPTQTFTRSIERIFVPGVLVFDLILLFAWLVIDEPFSDSLYRAMAVLVAASPCALAISTPSAVLAGIARAARGGVLVKGGGPLESLGTVEVIAFDKTGTLTEGKPRLTEAIPFDSVTVERLLAVALAIETHSDHPLASAIVRDAASRVGNETIPHARDVEALVGAGIQGVVDGQLAIIGKASLFTDESQAALAPINETLNKLKGAGRTTMVVKHGPQFLGLLAVMDTPRSTAKDVVAELRSLGVKRMLMLSGDNQQVASAVAQSVGLDEAFGDLMPEDKVRTIQMLSRAGGVAMVGDGVNDAPAMAGATVGIAMGAAGSDVALETADVALMADDLRHLPFAVGLSRKTRAIIRQNLYISLGMVLFLVPATTFGLSLGPAVVLHEGSTVVVVLNALRLLRYNQR